MEGKGVPPATEVAMEAVLRDDNLLDEILIRVAFPTSLVRAAAVCKSWLRLASAHAFLRRFRGLHPPRLLGFYIHTMSTLPPRFVPLPQPPELASVVCRGSFDLETLGCDELFMNCCCNGFFIITPLAPHYNNCCPSADTRRVYCPLFPARYTAILPPIPDNSVHDGFKYYEDDTVPRGGGDGLSYFHLAIGYKEQHSIMDVYVLQDGHWVIYTSILSDIPQIELEVNSLLADAKIYNLVRVNNILKLVLLDLVSSCLPVVDLPEEVELLCFRLVLADDSGVHLTHVKGSQLRVWLHRMDNNSVSNWFHVNSVCLREIWVNHMIPTCKFGYVLQLYAVSANSEFIILEMDDALYLFDIKRKDVKKVYELALLDRSLYSVIPFMMVWPPKFPVMKEGCDQKDRLCKVSSTMEYEVPQPIDVAESADVRLPLHQTDNVQL